MSKKLKKKITVKVMPGEAVFVSSAEVLEHIIATYEIMGADCQDRQEADSWFSVASDIREWLSRTYYSGEYTQDEEE